MKTQPPGSPAAKAPHRTWAALAALVTIPAALHAAPLEELHRLDAPGPGYREQAARLLDSPMRDQLPSILLIHWTTPDNTWDGMAPERSFPLLRGEFRDRIDVPAVTERSVLLPSDTDDGRRAEEQWSASLDDLIGRFGNPIIIELRVPPQRFLDTR